MAIIVTGAAGFIGHSVAHRLLDRGEDVVGIDNFNDYYDPSLKDARAATLNARRGFRMERIGIADAERMAALVQDNRVRRMIHLAAQAGVRYSLENPFAYERSNLRSEEHTSELQSLMRNSYAVFCLKKKKQQITQK